MPEAYRWVPADPREGALNVIGTWSVDESCWLYQEMYGQVFGRAAAVINFHRVQRLLVAMMRSWLLVLCSMYCNDASLQDLAAVRSHPLPNGRATIGRTEAGGPQHGSGLPRP